MHIVLTQSLTRHILPRFTDSLMYYALSLNSGSLAGDLFLNTFLLGLVEIPANIFCALGLQWRYLGRRLTASLSLLLAGVASVISIPLIVTGGRPWYIMYPYWSTDKCFPHLNASHTCILIINRKYNIQK